MTITDWVDDYVEKKRAAEAAVNLLRPGQRVFIGSSCGEPQHLVKALFFSSRRLASLEIVRLFSMESSPLTLVAAKTGDQLINFRSFYLGSAQSGSIARQVRFMTPINLSEISHLFKSRRVPVHAALIQVSPPDDFGWMSLGISVDVTRAAALSADLIIAQVNARMPRVLGNSFIHANQVNVIVEHDEPLLTVSGATETEAMSAMAHHLSTLVEDDSTLQIGLGTDSSTVIKALSNKNDLGIHTQYLTDPIMHLYSKGVITNQKKGFQEGKLVASGAIGTHNLYEFLDNNPAVEFHPSDHVNDPGIICRHHKMVSIHLAMTLDLTGQVATDALPHTHFSGITGMLDFMRGAVRSEGGKAIVMLSSTAEDGKMSRIVPLLENTPIVAPRGDVHHVITEFGVVNLFGKSIQERAMAMISIAHPQFRDWLFHEAKKLGYLGVERRLKKALHGVYPIGMEETFEIDGEPVLIRPVKVVDERRIQEHYYSLDRDDIIKRFFHDKKSFFRNDVENIALTDYTSDLALVAVMGEFGFGRVVGMGEYYLEPDKNMAEVSFTVSNSFKYMQKLLVFSKQPLRGVCTA